MARPWNSRTWSTADLITEVKRKARIPDSNDYSDSVILAEADDALLTIINDPVFTAREGREVYRTNRAVTADAIDGDGSAYILPPHGVAETINNVVYLNDSSDPDRQFNLQYVSPAQLPNYRYSVSSGGPGPGTPWGYTIEGQIMRVFPEPVSGSRQIRIVYARRPAKLVPTTDCRTVTAVADGGSGTTVLTLSSAPPATWVDDVSHIDITEPFVPHRLQYRDAIISNISGSDVTVAVDFDDISRDTVIDPDSSVSLSGENCYLQIPLEARKILSEQTASQILREIGDDTGADRLIGQVQAALPNLANMLQPRVKGQRLKITNRYSIMRGGRRTSRSWWY